MLAYIARRIIPVGIRVRARQYAAVRWLLGRLYAGEGRVRLAGTPYMLHFPSARLPGFGDKLATSDLTDRHSATRLIREYKCREVWDVGANIGLWSLDFAAQGPHVCVTSFEPDPDNVSWLEKNINLNGLSKRIAVRPVAISDVPGVAKFWADKYTGATGSLEETHDFVGPNYGVERTLITVRATTLDDELREAARPPEFLKIDVEGHELAVLRGARQLLIKHQPIIVIEVSQAIDDVTALLHECGYRLETPDGKPMDRAGYSTVCIPVGGQSIKS